MSELLSFAERVLSLEGALVEAGNEALEALVPAPLASRLRLPEHVRLAEDEAGGGHRVAYGTELLERLVTLVTGSVPVAAARVTAASVREGAAVRAAEQFVLRNGVFTLGSVRPLAGARLWLHAAYSLQADERREGLASATVSLHSGTPVEGFGEVAAASLEPAPSGAIPMDQAAGAVDAGLRACSLRAEAEGAGFKASVERRFERDRTRVDAYFADLLAELERRGKRGKLDQRVLEEKREVLRRERAAKLEALMARQQVRLEVRPVAGLLVRAPAYAVPLELRRRKASRTVDLEFDCATRRMVPLRCDGCGGPAPRPAACDEALHLLCEVCAPQAEGRLACAACRR